MCHVKKLNELIKPQLQVVETPYFAFCTIRYKVPSFVIKNLNYPINHQPVLGWQ
ncbi:hypothetical protein XBJ1_1929 [Xenorhabdus bovienii SS-2004]|uniref:Uncharacterized protein n=1 Tax=Xenorhabdus bovienii (strain SS-2004) TaxID=406818 RepID=D3V2U0_XENBS|nr:hypothetical protein XBJ1_1929 [Xenorhabdus bovienii SS-2004]